MDTALSRSRLQGLYVTIPTMFHDDAEFSVDHDFIGRHVRFLIDGGCVTGSAVVLTGGAAGDFMTMTFDERVTVAQTVVKAAAGRVPVVMGGQTTSTLELVRLARAAMSVGAEYLQLSPPFYFAHTEGDFYEYVLAAAQAAPEVGLIIYNTYWTSAGVSTDLVQRLAEIPSVVGLKWACPDSGMMEFEQIVSTHSERFTIIDNQMRWLTSHVLGARSIEAFEANYWPQWAISMWQALEDGRYAEVQREMVRVAMPLHQMWTEIERYTSGNGYPVKLCLELLGMGSSRDRPPTRDVRGLYLDKARQMMLKCGVPGVQAAPPTAH
jgi:dihydrodipicolinate synthase/N-acetylneuraminate lyase